MQSRVYCLLQLWLGQLDVYVVRIFHLSSVIVNSFMTTAVRVIGTSVVVIGSSVSGIVIVNPPITIYIIRDTSVSGPYLCTKSAFSNVGAGLKVRHLLMETFGLNLPETDFSL